MNHSIVITGSSRGIGLGLATEFLKRNQNVCIAGQSQQSVDSALSTLQPFTREGEAAVTGFPCKVDDAKQVQSLWNEAKATFGKIDIWINNAGVSNAKRPFETTEIDDIKQVIDTNVIGTMTCSRIALAEMSAQGSGRIYNMEGFGSDGRTAPGLAIYGASKSAVSYFTKALIRETRGSDIQVGYISPGIVVTDLLLRDRETMPPEAWARVRRTYEILADHVETVTPWLADQILADNNHGTRIAWLTKGKVMGRLAAKLFGKNRNIFDDRQRN